MTAPSDAAAKLAEYRRRLAAKEQASPAAAGQPNITINVQLPDFVGEMMRRFGTSNGELRVAPRTAPYVG